jgi:hypothetical protein
VLTRLFRRSQQQRDLCDPGLVIAARLQNGDNHQVSVREKPFFGFDPRGFGRASDGAEVFVASEAAQVIHANPCQSYDFVFSEYFLAGLDSHHFLYPACCDDECKLNAANVACNSPSVWYVNTRIRREHTELVVLSAT